MQWPVHRSSWEGPCFRLFKGACGDLLATTAHRLHQAAAGSCEGTTTWSINQQWQAVADLANLLQIDDLYVALESLPHAAPECDKLAPLPCNHPCSPLP